MAKLLAKVGRDPKTCATQIAVFCRGGAPRSKLHDQRGHREGGRRRGVAGGEEEGEGEEGESKSATTRGGKKNRVAFASDDDPSVGTPTTPSTASLAEILATFGFVFESAGAAVKPSVAEAFAMLRLHAQPAEARAAGEAAKRYLSTEGTRKPCIWPLMSSFQASASVRLLISCPTSVDPKLSVVTSPSAGGVSLLVPHALQIENGRTV